MKNKIKFRTDQSFFDLFDHISNLFVTLRTYQSSFAQNDELLILSAWIGDKVGIRFRSSKQKKTEWTSLDMEREVHSAINSYLVQLSFHYSKQYYVKLDHKELLFSFFSQTTFSMIVLWPQIKLLRVCVEDKFELEN